MSFNVSEEEAAEICKMMENNDFPLLSEKFKNLEDIRGEKHNIKMDDIYGFEFVL